LGEIPRATADPPTVYSKISAQPISQAILRMIIPAKINKTSQRYYENIMHKICDKDALSFTTKITNEQKAIGKSQAAQQIMHAPRRFNLYISKVYSSHSLHSLETMARITLVL
jgi:hypothetical protein